jgi:shikimate kinase
MSGAVVLVGLSGSGKSTVGRLVAAELGVPFLDTDDAVAAIAGKAVPQIFADEGEEHFRALETQVIVEQVALLGRCVVATGGGAVLRPANVAALGTGNLVVWLDAPAEVLAARLTGHVATAVERPLLRGGEARTRLEELAAARAPLYTQVAALRLDTAGLSAGEVAAAVVAAAGRWTTGD